MKSYSAFVALLSSAALISSPVFAGRVPRSVTANNQPPVSTEVTPPADPVSTDVTTPVSPVVTDPATSGDSAPTPESMGPVNTTPADAAPQDTTPQNTDNTPASTAAPATVPQSANSHSLGAAGIGLGIGAATLLTAGSVYALKKKLNHEGGSGSTNKPQTHQLPTSNAHIEELPSEEALDHKNKRNSKDIAKEHLIAEGVGHEHADKMVNHQDHVIHELESNFAHTEHAGIPETPRAPTPPPAAPKASTHAIFAGHGEARTSDMIATRGIFSEHAQAVKDRSLEEHENESLNKHGKNLHDLMNTMHDAEGTPTHAEAHANVTKALHELGTDPAHQSEAAKKHAANLKEKLTVKAAASHERQARAMEKVTEHATRH